MIDGITRVMNAIRHQSGTPVARGELTLDRGFVRDFLRWWAYDRPAEALSDTDLLIAFSKALQLDLVCLQSDGPSHNRLDLGVEADQIDRISNEGLFVFWIVNGAFQMTMTQQDVMPQLMRIAASPADFGAKLRQLSDQVIANMAHGVTAGAHGIIIADDIAYRQSTYMSPAFVEQHLVPVWQAQVAAARQLGVPIFFHSDGNLNAVLPSIVAAGFDGLQCIEPAAGLDIRKIKTKYGRDLCLMGNLDPALLSGQGDPGDPEEQYHRLHRAVIDLMASASDGGGFIFGTCSGLHARMSPDLVYHMYHLASMLDPTPPEPAVNPESPIGMKCTN